MTAARSIAAAAAVVSLLCFSACGDSAGKTANSLAKDTGSSSVSSLTEEESVTDEELLSYAKQTIEKFYEYANEGSYSEMTALCNEDIAEYYGYSDQADGEVSDHAELGFFDENCAVVPTDDGGRLAVWQISVSRDTALDPTNCYMAVSNANGKYLIEDICEYKKDSRAEDFFSLKFDEYMGSYASSLELAATMVTYEYGYFEYGAKVSEDLTITGKLEDGIYSSTDGSEFISNVEAETEFLCEMGLGTRRAWEYAKELDSCEYTIEIEGGNLKKGTLTCKKGELSFNKDLSA